MNKNLRTHIAVFHLKPCNPIDGLVVFVEIHQTWYIETSQLFELNRLNRQYTTREQSTETREEAKYEETNDVVLQPVTFGGIDPEELP